MTDIVERLRAGTNEPTHIEHVVRTVPALPVMLEAAAEIENLRDALAGLLKHYTALVNSGDAGFWDCEEEQVVIAARQALGETKG